MKNLIKFSLLSFFLSLSTFLFLSFSADKLEQKDELIIPSPKILNSLIENSQIKSDDFVAAINTKIRVRKVADDVFNNVFVKLNNGEFHIQTVSIFSNSNKIIGLGIHFYSKIDENYFFNIYKLNETSGKLIKTDSYIANPLTTQDIFLTNHTYFGKSEIDLLYDDKFTKFNTKSNYSDLSLALKKRNNSFTNTEFDFYNNISKNVPDEPCGYVGNCPDGGGQNCIPGSFFCADGICGSDELQHMSDDLEYKTSGILIPNKYYLLRDSFLKNSNLGRKYIDIYYGSTSHIKDVLDPDIVLSLLKVFPEINNAIDNLLNTQYKGVVISKNLKSQIKIIINKMKSKSSSSVFKETLKTFEKDLERFSEKDSKQINSLLNE